MDNLAKLEAIANELVETFEMYAPPVIIETILQHPKDGMWDSVDINQLSGSFLSIKDQYSPRMSLARLLARHLASSPWGKERGVFDILRTDENLLRVFARMLVMPSEMVNGLSSSERNAQTMSVRFEVPEDDAAERLRELYI